MSNTRKVLYSALVGNYDDIPELKFKKEGWEYILFTDQTTAPEYNGWTIYPLQKVIINDNTRSCRWHKMHPHKLFDNATCSVYIDCNIILNSDFIYYRAEELLNKDIKLATIKHPFRDCIYDEAEACIAIGKDSPRTIEKQISKLKSENYPSNNGLFETNIFFRNHNYDAVSKFNESWWEMIYNGSKRDQLSMCYLTWKQNLKVDFLFPNKETSARSSKDFNFKEAHNNSKVFREISQKEYTELIGAQKRLQSIRKLISYKIFCKLEIKLRSLFVK